MTITPLSSDHPHIAQVRAPSPLFHDGLGMDLPGILAFSGYAGLLLYKDQIHPDFFDLSTRIAGEFFQKCVNYRLSIAIVGDFSDSSEALRDFIRESNKQGQILFLKAPAEALAKWT